jgi:mevalonate kinase
MQPIQGMPALRIVVTNTYVPKETSKLVAGVKVLKGVFPAVMDPVLIGIDGLAKSVLSAIAEANHKGEGESATDEASKAKLYASLSRLIRMNHSLLNAIGVGHEALDRVSKSSSALGFSTKLTGAGGGGCALTLLPDNPSIELAAFAINTDLGQQSIAPAKKAEAGGTSAEKDLADRIHRFSEEMKGYGWDCFETRLGGCGVLLH